MPIRKEFREAYKTPEALEAKAAAMERAGGHCEICRRKQHSYYWKAEDGSGRWWPEHEPPGIDAVEFKKVVLTTAHLNHDPYDNRLENLAVLCQACHLKYDYPRHYAVRRRNRAWLVGQMWLCRVIEYAPFSQAERRALAAGGA